MPRPDEKNIFEAAAKQLSKHKPVPAAHQQNQQPAYAESIKTPHIPKEFWSATDKETREMLDQIKAMKQDLQSKLELIQKKGALIGGNFKNYMDNQKNFTSAEWDNIQKAKDLLGDKIWGALGKTIARPPERAQESSAEAQTPSPPSKLNDRKGKTLGSRKKWIPVR